MTKYRVTLRSGKTFDIEGEANLSNSGDLIIFEPISTVLYPEKTRPFICAFANHAWEAVEKIE